MRCVYARIGTDGAYDGRVFVVNAVNAWLGAKILVAHLREKWSARAELGVIETNVWEGDPPDALMWSWLEGWRHHPWVSAEATAADTSGGRVADLLLNPHPSRKASPIDPEDHDRFILQAMVDQWGWERVHNWLLDRSTGKGG